MLPEPVHPYVLKRINDFDARYGLDDRTVALLFRQWPRNNNYEEVLAKIIVLNRLYYTNIYQPRPVAQHIVELGVDAALACGDVSLISRVANVDFGQVSRSLYSFATKYCAWHCPDQYQMYDSYVDSLLWQYAREFQFSRFRRCELRDYEGFVCIVDEFRKHFKLQDLSRKEIDKFLWLEGIDQDRATAVKSSMEPEPANAIRSFTPPAPPAPGLPAVASRGPET